VSAIDSRISKLLPGLSVKERAVLALKAQNAGEETTDLTRSMPPEQRHQFNRYMAPTFVAGCHFDVLVNVITSQIDNLSFNLERIDLLDRAATMLEEDHPEDIASQPVRAWRQMSKSKGLVTVPIFLRAVAEELRQDAFKELSVRWRELRAVEIVAEEIAQSFDGEDPLHPDIRARLVTGAAVAKETNASLFPRPRRLPEPEEDFLDRTRALIDHGFAALGLVEE